MNAVLSKLGLRAEQVKAMATVPVNAERGVRNAEKNGRSAEGNSAIRNPQSALPVGRVIPVTGPQVAPVLSDAEVDGIADRIADRVATKVVAKLAGAKVKPKVRARRGTVVRSQGAPTVPVRFRDIAKLVAIGCGIEVESLGRRGRAKWVVVGKFLFRELVRKHTGLSSLATDQLLGLSWNSTLHSEAQLQRMAKLNSLERAVIWDVRGRYQRWSESGVIPEERSVRL